MVIRDQVYGDIEFTDDEMCLIRSESFERLRYIKQLGFAEFKFPGATHNRYAHSLGVCECVTAMYKAVCKNYPQFFRKGDLELLRLMALCHDLGHAPFSHASEELSDITHEQRLVGILRYEKDNLRLTHSYGIEPWELVSQVYLGEGLTYMSDSHLVTLHSFLDGFIDADKIDYLIRDALNCGVAYGNFDKQGLINNLTIVRNSSGKEVIGLLLDGVQALESFILARYYMFSRVYLCPEEQIRRRQYCAEIKTMLKGGKYPLDVKSFLSLADTRYIRRLKFLHNDEYVLVFDEEYNAGIRQRVGSLLREDLKSGSLVCDILSKAVFREEADDATVYILDPILGTVKPCADVSSLLKSMEFMRIHKLRYYAKRSDAERLGEKIKEIVGVKAVWY